MKSTLIAMAYCTLFVTAPACLRGACEDKNMKEKPMQSNCFTTSSNAKKTAQDMMVQKQQNMSPFKFTFGAQYSRVRQFAHKMPTYTGNLGGMFAEFEYKKRNSVYADASALWNWGSLGAGKNPNTGVKEGVWEGQLGGSYSWGSCDRWTITAFTGFAYRRYVNDLQAVPLQPDAMTLEYQNYYVPVGFKLNYDITSDWRVSLNGKILPAVDDKVYVYGVKGAYWKQDRKPSYSAELPITWSMPVMKSSFVEVTATPFFRYWQLGAVEILGFPTWKQVYWGGQITGGLAF